tara:strand:- start:122361 stop:122666 length:306 start_codon:yes stop_codon:yes gene_type:complete
MNLLDFIKLIPRTIKDFGKAIFNSTDLKYSFLYQGSVYTAVFDFGVIKVSLVSLRSEVGMGHTKERLRNILTEALAGEDPEEINIRDILSTIGATNIHYIR